MQKMKSKIYNLLRASEKYTKTDMVYLAKGGTWLTLGQIISSASAFLLAIAFANLLPKETYGVYRYILSMAGILSISTLGGIDTAITQAVARGYEGSLILGLKTRIRWGLLGGLGAIILAGYYFINENHTLAISFLIISAFLPFNDSFNVYSSFLQGKKLFGASTKYFIASQIISAAVMITVLFFTKNLFLILLAYFLSITITRLIFLKITLKKFLQNKKDDRETISYGKHLSLIGILDNIASYIDRLLVFHYLGPAEVAIYSFAIAMPEQIKALIKGVNVLAFPKFSQRSKEEIKININQKMAGLAIVITLITIIYIVSAPIIFKLFFPQYMESVIYSQIFSISLIAGTGSLVHSALKAHKLKMELYKFNILGSLITIILLFLFLHYYGLMGIVLARVISRFINFGLAFFLLRQSR